MKKIYAISFGLSFLLSAFSQDAKIAKADKLYAEYSYDKAVEKYLQLEEKSPRVYRKIAESYQNLHNYVMAEDYYNKLVESGSAEALDYYHYAEVLKNNGKYLEAMKNMEKFHRLGGDSRSERHLNDKNYIEELMDSGHTRISHLSMNTEQQDFSPAYYNGKIVFTSSREKTKPVKRNWNWNGLPFLDLYVADVGPTGELESIEELHTKINKKYHEGPACFNGSGNVMMFTRNNYSGSDEKGVKKLKLFETKKSGEDWSEALAFAYNSDSYSVGHPALSGDGKTLYFASDMPGGEGGTDIYKSVLGEDGMWSKPENLGKQINTEGNEMFPFLHAEGYLIFASNGHPGLGGLDLFIAQEQNGSFSKVLNMKSPVNSRFDDFGMCLDRQMKKGYFSSNRSTGNGSDDIYAVEIIKDFVFNRIIKGRVVDDKGNILSDAQVMIYNNRGVLLGEVQSAKDGNFEFEIEDPGKYELKAAKTDYLGNTKEVKLDAQQQESTAELILPNQPKFELYGAIKDASNGEIIQGVKIDLLNNVSGKEEAFKSNGDGTFSLSMDKKLGERISYNLHIEKEGYLTKTVTYNRELDKPGRYDVFEELKVKLDKIEVGSDLGKILNIQPIYFDLGKFDIRDDAEIELNKIVKAMQENPAMQIELGSHTDCRGSKKFNQNLSAKRAKASADYIKNLIDDPSRITSKGYGESRLVNECECEGNVKVNCTDEQHQANRRTEFRIVKMEY